MSRQGRFLLVLTALPLILAFPGMLLARLVSPLALARGAHLVTAFYPAFAIVLGLSLAWILGLGYRKGISIGLAALFSALPLVLFRQIPGSWTLPGMWVESFFWLGAVLVVYHMASSQVCKYGRLGAVAGGIFAGSIRWLLWSVPWPGALLVEGGLLAVWGWVLTRLPQREKRPFPWFNIPILAGMVLLLVFYQGLILKDLKTLKGLADFDTLTQFRLALSRLEQGGSFRILRGLKAEPPSSLAGLALATAEEFELDSGGTINWQVPLVGGSKQVILRVQGNPQAQVALAWGSYYLEHTGFVLAGGETAFSLEPSLMPPVIRLQRLDHNVQPVRVRIEVWQRPDQVDLRIPAQGSRGFASSQGIFPADYHQGEGSSRLVLPLPVNLGQVQFLAVALEVNSPATLTFQATNLNRDRGETPRSASLWLDLLRGEEVVREQLLLAQGGERLEWALELEPGSYFFRIRASSSASSIWDYLTVIISSGGGFTWLD